MLISFVPERERERHSAAFTPPDLTTRRTRIKPVTAEEFYRERSFDELRLKLQRYSIGSEDTVFGKISSIEERGGKLQSYRIKSTGPKTSTIMLSFTGKYPLVVLTIYK